MSTHEVIVSNNVCTIRSKRIYMFILDSSHSLIAFYSLGVPAAQIQGTLHCNKLNSKEMYGCHCLLIEQTFKKYNGWLSNSV